MVSDSYTRSALVVAGGLLALFGVSVLTTSGIVGVDVPVLTGSGSTKVQFALLLGVALTTAAGLVTESTTAADG